MKCSICMSTRNKAEYLGRTLQSIRVQKVPFEYEIIVCDDGSTDHTAGICSKYEVRYIYLENNTYRNPSFARNKAFRAARGDIIINQSDEVIHDLPCTVEHLCDRLYENQFLIATVFNYDVNRQKRLNLYTGVHNRRPFFFLGSLWRKDLYEIGGCCEDFTGPGFDDDWLGKCLIEGLGLSCNFLADIIGYHQDHPRPANLAQLVAPSRQLFEQKCREVQEHGWNFNSWEI